MQYELRWTLMSGDHICVFPFTDDTHLHSDVLGCSLAENKLAESLDLETTTENALHHDK